MSDCFSSIIEAGQNDVQGFQMPLHVIADWQARACRDERAARAIMDGLAQVFLSLLPAPTVA